MTTELTKAMDLSEQGMVVFPVHHTESNEKKPLTQHGHLDATQDPGVIQDWFQKWPFAKVGVACGKSGIAVADVDTKNGKDGWTSLDEAWLDLGTPFSYDTGTGGSHLVYLAPEGVDLNGVANYRGMDGVDRRAGSSWVLWAGDVPKREDLHPAPEWLVDESRVRAVQGFKGTVSDWYSNLVPGEPNIMVRRAIDAISDDMGHSDMVSATYEAIRLGAEGATGVPELIDALENAWMNRPAENHTTPEGAWEFKFQEALLGGLEKYGDTIDLLKNLPAYNIGIVPSGISDTLVGTPGGKAEFSRLLGELIKETEDDNRILSILWNAAATKDLARDWGLEFCNRRIQEARVKPEPTRENPRIEEKREAEKEGKGSELSLLTEEERQIVRDSPSFPDIVESAAKELGYDQLKLFRSAGWNIMSMAFGLKGAVAVSGTQKHGLNIWQMVPAYSGTGKSVVYRFQMDILDVIMDETDEEIKYDLGADSSIEGLNLALLQRDDKASLFAKDEASGWFKKLKESKWTAGMEDTLSDWYMGRVSASNKISLKEYRGKRADTSMNLYMMATPKLLMELLSRDQFFTGFLARVMWTYGDPRQVNDDTFEIFKDSADGVTNTEDSPVIRGLALDLIAARSSFSAPVVLKPTQAVKERMSQAYKTMYESLVDQKNWDIFEPALTRHMETMLKCAGLCAMYRESPQIEMTDALHAIEQVETWLKNLSIVADEVGAGDFQRRVVELEAFLRVSGGAATSTKIYHRFGSWITRDSKEIENVLSYMVQSGAINREDTNGGLKYALNGE